MPRHTVFSAWRIELSQLRQSLARDGETKAAADVKRAITLVDTAMRSTKKWKDALAAGKDK